MKKRYILFLSFIVFPAMHHSQQLQDDKKTTPSMVSKGSVIIYDASTDSFIKGKRENSVSQNITNKTTSKDDIIVITNGTKKIIKRDKVNKNQILLIDKDGNVKKYKTENNISPTLKKMSVPNQSKVTSPPQVSVDDKKITIMTQGKKKIIPIAKDGKDQLIIIDKDGNAKNY